ncbi:PKD domain-containing protein [Streptacidiphilus sp. MAP12-33]|uniref:PKD domain-containing protein n=1 Tax=Streptacidiphilus sp. MAP12-33 TaxID=3156266 RepID=UPI003514A07B
MDRSASTCSDQGTGSAAQPFCTVQSAVDAAQPGEIVLIANGTYSGFVVHHSGTPTAPITIKAQNYDPSGCDVCLYGNGTTPAATLDGVHDVRIQQLSLFSGANSDAVALAGAQSVTLDQDSVFLSPQNAGAAASAAVVRIGTGSSSIALTRSTLQVDATGYGLRVEPGTSGIQVASDTLGGDGQPALSVSGGSGVDIAGDSLWSWNASALTVDGSSIGVSVENTTLYTDVRGGPTAPVVSVAADSVAGVHEDYNALNVFPKSTPEYDWGGTPIATTAAFAAATTQGAHETDQVPVVSLASPSSEGSGLIDSGDAQAPGELSTDLYGNPRVRDPQVSATGSAGGYVDRGAIEFQDPIQDPVLTPASTGVVPFSVTVAPGPETAWKKALRVTVDFGDGTSPVSEPAGQGAEHIYTMPGRYTETAVTTDTDGSTHSSQHGVDVLTTTPVHALFSASSGAFASGAQGEVVPGYFTFSTVGTADAWEIRNERIDYGDGTSDALGTPYHSYRSIGVYHPSLTVTDLLGRTSTTTTTVIVGDELVPLSFADAYRSYDSSWAWAGDHAIPAHGTLRVSATTLQARNSGNDADAVVLNVSVPVARSVGYLTVFPEGTARPAAPTVSFTAGRSTSNQVTALIGKDGYIDLYNGSNSPLPLTIDTYATQNHNWEAFAYQPLAPSRILGLQGSGAAVAGRGSTSVSVTAAAGVPADARAVLLAVTASAGHGAGSVTVYGDSQKMPNTPALSWASGQTVENLVLVPLTNGKVVLHNGGSGQVLLRADVLGYDSQTMGSTVHLPVAPTLFLDTRHGFGAPARQLAPHQSLRVRVAGVGGLPTTGVAAATINVTVLGSTASGYLEVHPDGSSPVADVPAVHWATGQTVSGAWVTRVGADGYVDLYNGGSRPVSVVADLSGIDYLYSAPAS